MVPFNGTQRRIRPWHGLINVVLDEFMENMNKVDILSIRKRLVVQASNSEMKAEGAIGNHMIEADEYYAVNCPDSRYMEACLGRSIPASLTQPSPRGDFKAKVYLGRPPAAEHDGSRASPTRRRRLVPPRRDKECNLHSTSMLGGTGKSYVSGDCRYAMTKARVKALEAAHSAR